MGASAPAQARALLAKSAVYQRRNTATNVCLVAAPIFFCVLLAMLQLLANNLILAQRDNNCGCQCTECCVPMRTQRPWTDAELDRIAAGETLTPRFDRTETCSSLDIGYCERVRNATCRSYNDSNCRLQFSSPRQAIFCPIPQPSSWPPVMQTPRFSVRAGGSTTQWLPFTGSNMTAARAVASNLVDSPELPNLQAIIDLVRTDPLSLLNLEPAKILELVLPMLAPGGLVKAGGESVEVAQLSRLELKFGSPLKSYTDYYLENAFINGNTNNSRVQFLLPEGQCNAAGLSNVTHYGALPLAEMLLRYYNATYPVIMNPLLAFFNVTPNKIVAGLEDSPVSGITSACVDLLQREANNATHLDRRLYCGFGIARCDGTYFVREYGGAWNFKELGPTTFNYDAYYNLSLPLDNGPMNYRIPELLNMATKAWTKTYWGDLPIVYNVRNRLIGVMSFPKLPTVLKLDFSVILGPLFYTWVVQMLMPSLLQQLVYEKEKRLRMMMKMHGLGDGAYWLVTYLWYLMLYCVYMAFFIVFGSLIRLKLFTTSSYTMQIVLYFVFGNNMIAFMFMASSFFSSSRTATVVAFLYIFASGLIGELLLRTLMQQPQPYILAVQLVPGFALYRGLFEFSEYSIRALFSNVDGLRWQDLNDPGNGMVGVLVILTVEWPIFMILGWYLEQVLSTGTGVRRHPLFFLQSHKPKDDVAALKPPPVNEVVSYSAIPSTPAANAAAANAAAPTTPAARPTGSGPVAEGAESTSGAGAGGGSPGGGGDGSPGVDGDGSPGVDGDGSVTTDVVAIDDGELLPGRPTSSSGSSCTSSRRWGGSAGGGAGGGVPTITAVALPAAAVLDADDSPRGGNTPSPARITNRDNVSRTIAGASAGTNSRISARAPSVRDARILVQPAAAPSPKALKVAVAEPPGLSGSDGDVQRRVTAGCKAGFVADGDGGDGGGGGGQSGTAFDVAAEADRVAAMSAAELAATPIVVRGLAKVFAKDRTTRGRGGGGWLGCVMGAEQRQRVAVRTLTLGIERGECFGLLGPNGAGKTTTINMLTGFLEPTAGDALVEGCSVLTRMPEIYRMMGVCPQENLLWEQLTGEEHLQFYGRLKGLKGKPLKEAVDAAVKSVKLHVNNAGKRRVGAYSGGMKRRLSVAISFIGNPQVVYLDEPSTGLDPASRRGLWDVVRQHKDGRAIILTTHSMEEAEILCDRLGIFVDGQLVCVGNPREITSRYAGYLVFTLMVGPGHEDAAQAFVLSLSPNAHLTYALGGMFKYELPTTDITLAGVFGAMTSAKEQMQVLDWGVANATLEEVFIKFARQIGAETRDQ